jgi:hypothetical protein
MIRLLASFLLIFSVNTTFSQNLWFVGEPIVSHKSKIQSLSTGIRKISKCKIYHYETLYSEKKRKDLNFNYRSQVNQYFSESNLIETIEQIGRKVKKNRPTYIISLNDNFSIKNLRLNLTAINNVDKLIEKINSERKANYIIIFDNNILKLNLEEPNSDVQINGTIANLKGSISSHAPIKSIKFKISLNRTYEMIEIDELTQNGHEYQFWQKIDLSKVPANSNFYIDFIISDNEGNSLNKKLGPFKKEENLISPRNCYFKYYDQIRDVALVRNFKSMNVYWFPIFSEVDPSNLEFVLKNDLGGDHIKIRLQPNINYVHSGINEYCIGISCSDLKIGLSDCECKFNGKMLLRHLENKSESEALNIYLKDLKPDFKYPLGDCSK